MNDYIKSNQISSETRGYKRDFFKKNILRNIKYYRKWMFNQYLWMRFTFLLIRGKYISIFLPVKRYYIMQKKVVLDLKNFQTILLTIYLRKSETCILHIY